MKWKTHMDLILPKLSRTYVIRSMYFLNDIYILKIIYYAYFYSVVEYGIICWGNSSLSRKVFLLQKKIVRIKTDVCMYVCMYVCRMKFEREGLAAFIPDLSDWN
jgi:hypothetical protein